MGHARHTNSLANRRLTVAVIFATVAVAYLSLLTKNYYWDGIFFAQSIEDAPRLNASLFHPNHLFYSVAGYLAYRITTLMGLGVRSLTVLQLMNCLAGAGCACLIFRILQKCFASFYISLVLTAVFAFSATWWKFSTDADSYIFSVFFLLLSFYLALPDREPRPFALAGAHFAAMCFHQLAFFFFPVAILAIILQTRGSLTNQRLRKVAAYVIGVSLLTVATFVFSFYLVSGGLALRSFLRWITSFSPEHGFTFSARENLLYSWRSQWRVVFGGRVSFVREFWGPVIIALVTGLAVVAACFFYRLLRYFRELGGEISRAWKQPSIYRDLTIICVIWIAVYVLFLFFFIPQNTFYRLFYLPPIMVLLGAALASIESDSEHHRRYRAALFAGIIFTANLALSAYPYARVHANPPLELAMKLSQTWPPHTAIYFTESNSDNSLVRYFNRSTTWIEKTPELVHENLRDRTRQIWLDTTLIDRFQATPEGVQWLELHTIERPDCELVNRKYRIRFFQVNTESFPKGPGEK